MAKLKKAQTGTTKKPSTTTNTTTKKPAVVSDTTQYRDSTMTPAMKAYYEKLIRDKAKQAEEDRKQREKTGRGKKGIKVVAKKAKYGAKKVVKKKK